MMNLIGVRGIGFGSSDPTPTLPEREGARFETNELITSKEADSQNIPERNGAKFDAS